MRPLQCVTASASEAGLINPVRIVSSKVTDENPKPLKNGGELTPG